MWGAVLDSVYLHTKSRDAAARADLADRSSEQVEAALGQLARARPRHLGGARRAQALHLLEAHVLGRRRPRRAAGRAARGPRARRALAGGGRRDPRRHLRQRASTSAACSRQHYDTDALDASVLLMPLVRFLPARRRARAGHRAGHRRRAHRRRARAALPRRGDRRRPARARRARSRSARSGWSRRWSRSARSRRARALCEKLLSYASPLRPLRRGDRPAHGPPPRATSRRRSPTWR